MNDALGALGEWGEAREAMLIGACLHSPSEYMEVVGRLCEDDFWNWRYRLIWQGLMAVAQRGQSPTLPNLASHLSGQGSLEKVGGVAAIAATMEMVCADQTHASEHATAVLAASDMRRVVTAAHEIIAKAKPPYPDPEALIAQAQDAVFAVASARQARAHERDTKAILEEALRDILTTRASDSGLSTGLPPLDACIGSLRPGLVYVLAARPSMGKTSLAVQIADSAAVTQGASVCLVSLEVPGGLMAQHFIRSRARVSGDVEAGSMSSADADRLKRAEFELSVSNLHIEDPYLTTFGTVASAARLTHMRHGLGLVVIDYLQLMRTDKQSESKQVEVSVISAGVKGLARQLNVPVILLSQLNRGVESRDDKRPRLSDLRDSGSIEQDADVVLMLYRPGYYYPDNRSIADNAEIIVAKNRHGKTGIVPLIWRGNQRRFLTSEQAAEEAFREDRPPAVPRL